MRTWPRNQSNMSWLLIMVINKLFIVSIVSNHKLAENTNDESKEWCDMIDDKS